MPTLINPFIELDPHLSYPSMSDCMVAGLSGWCGPECASRGYEGCSWDAEEVGNQEDIP
jgi:hypothetical protein